MKTFRTHLRRTEKAVTAAVCIAGILAVLGAAGCSSKSSNELSQNKINRAETPSQNTSDKAETPSQNTSDKADTPSQNTSDEANVSAQITPDKAKEAALSDAGLTSSDVTFTKTELDRENGIYVYDIEFYTDSTKYEYEINASTGAVYSKDVEQRNNGNTGQSSNGGSEANTSAQITPDKAKEAALSDAGLTSSDVTFTKTELDRENGIYVYDIEFYTDSTKYEYEINASTGAVYSKDVERRNNGNTGQSSNNGGVEDYITEDKAKAIAVEHAGFSAADVNFSKVKLDNEDGQKVYEIEFYKNGREYEYEINAISGEVVKFKID